MRKNGRLLTSPKIAGHSNQPRAILMNIFAAKQQES